MTNKKVEVQLFEKLKKKITTKKPPEEEKKEELQNQLKEKYGVMKEIPEQNIEEEKIEEVRHHNHEDKQAPDLLFRVERIDGKLEMLESFRQSTEERTTNLTEEIGELRSMLLEKEKKLGDIEADVEKVLASVAELDLEKIKKIFKKRDEEILELTANLERVESTLKAIQEENKEMKDALDKIKSMENLVEISNKINEKLEKIDESKDYVDKIATKVETIFYDINSKLMDFENKKGKIVELDELSIELVKTLDKITLEITKFAKVEDVNKLNSILEGMKKDLDKSKGYKTEILSAVEKDVITPISTKVDGLNKRLKEIEDRMKDIIKVEDIDKLKKDMNRVKMHEGIVPEFPKLSLNVEEINETLVEIKFVELISLLPYVTNRVELNDRLTEIGEIVREMKEKDIWNEDKENFLKSFLANLAEKLSSDGYLDMSSFLEAEAQKF
jgi:chromosome segregation ATPase